MVFIHPVVQFDVRLRSLLTLRGATTNRAVVSHVDFRLVLSPRYEFQTIELLVHVQKRQQALMQAQCVVQSLRLRQAQRGLYSLEQDALLAMSDPHVFCSLQLSSELPD